MYIFFVRRKSQKSRNADFKLLVFNKILVHIRYLSVLRYAVHTQIFGI